MPVREPLHLLYRNWRGEIAVRSVSPRSIYYGVTQWHPEPQWFMSAMDDERGSIRDFSMADIISTHRTLDDAQLALSLTPQTLDDAPINENDEFILPEGIWAKVIGRADDAPLRTLEAPAPITLPTYILMEMDGPSPGATWTASESFLRQRCLRKSELVKETAHGAV